MTKQRGFIRGWELHYDEFMRPTHSLKRQMSGKGEGIESAYLDDTDLCVEVVTLGPMCSAMRDEMYIPLDALAELLLAAGWEVTRK